MKSRGELPHLYYPQMNQTRIINPHRNPVGGGGPALTTAFTGTPSSSLRSDYSGWLGCEFTVWGSSIDVYQLGRWIVSGNTGTIEVGIFTTSGTKLGSVNIDTSAETPGSFAYAALSSPVTLSASTDYAIGSLETNGGDQWYEFQGGYTPASEVTAFGRTYGATSPTIGFPGDSTMYVPVNFKFA